MNRRLTRPKKFFKLLTGTGLLTWNQEIRVELFHLLSLCAQKLVIGFGAQKFAKFRWTNAFREPPPSRTRQLFQLTRAGIVGNNAKRELGIKWGNERSPSV